MFFKVWVYIVHPLDCIWPRSVSKFVFTLRRPRGNDGRKVAAWSEPPDCSSLDNSLSNMSVPANPANKEKKLKSCFNLSASCFQKESFFINIITLQSKVCDFFLLDLNYVDHHRTPTSFRPLERRYSNDFNESRIIWYISMPEFDWYACKWMTMLAYVNLCLFMVIL